MLKCRFYIGCDTVSSFYGKGKTSALKIVKSKEEHAEHFSNLGSTVSPTKELITGLCKYVCHLYGYDDVTDVNLVRYLMFKAGKYDEQLLPPNEDSLVLHIQRAAYQCFIWRHALQPVVHLPNFNEHGWNINENGHVEVRWMNQPPAPDSIMELVNCKCKKGCETNRCSCRKSGLKCTDVCKCCDCKNGDGDQEATEEDLDMYEAISSESDRDSE